MSDKTAKYGMLIALSFLFGYIESLIPFSFGIPGIKLGLANLVTLSAIYMVGAAAAFWIMLVRIVLIGFTFGSMSTMIYSLAGGILSWGIMTLFACRMHQKELTVSIAGGITHNLGQLLTAMLILKSTTLIYYYPVLLISGAVSGAVIGFVGHLVLKRLPKEMKAGAQDVPMQGNFGEDKVNRTSLKPIMAAVCILLLAAVLITGLSYIHRKNAAPKLAAVIYLENEEYAHFPLDTAEDTELDITGKSGITNHVVIKDGTADVTHADCPDQICVQHAPIDTVDDLIVCMPNQLIVTVEEIE